MGLAPHWLQKYNKNRDKQKSKQIYDLLGFLYSIPALQESVC